MKYVCLECRRYVDYDQECSWCMQQAKPPNGTRIAKPFVIESRMKHWWCTDGDWSPWRVSRRYKNAKCRDEAMKALEKQQHKWVQYRLPPYYEVSTYEKI